MNSISGLRIEVEDKGRKFFATITDFGSIQILQRLSVEISPTIKVLSEHEYKLLEWEEALEFAGDRNIRLRAYAKKRLVELQATAETSESTFVKRHEAHKHYGYKVDRQTEVKRVRDTVKQKAGYFPRRNWTDAEETYLIENYRSQSILDMATHLKRPYESVAHKTVRLGLTKNRKWKVPPSERLG